MGRNDAGLNNDRLGSVTDMVDTNATLRLHRVFDSFGNIVEETHYDEIGVEVTPEYDGYLDVTFAYTGRLLDKATGLQNNLNPNAVNCVARWIALRVREVDGSGSVC